MKDRIKLLFVICVVAVLAACSFSNPEESISSGDEGASYKNEIKVGLDVDATKLDPRLASDSSSKRVTEVVYNGLIRLNANLEAMPDLAESWENPDELTWIFNLRKDVKFHDGEELTAEDVKYTFDTILDPAFQSNSLALFSPITSVEVIDDYKVQFNLSQPYAPLLSYLEIGIVPKHLAEADSESLTTKPVGTGPYKFESWDKNNKIVLTANKEYWNGAPKTDKLVYFIIPDNSTRVASLESGDIDFIHSPLSASDVERMRGNKDFVTEEKEGVGYTYLNFNMKNDKTADLKVRQAISHLIDKETISKAIYRGMDKPAKSPLIPASWAYSDDVPDFEYSPEKAKELLKEAGYEDTNGDGIVEKNGVDLEIELSTHTEDPNRIQVVEYLQNELSKNGIKTSVTTTEWSTFSNNMMEGKYQVALLGWLNLFDPDRATYNQFHSSSGNNYGKYNNPKVDALLEEGRKTNDQAKRQEIYKEIATIVNEEVAYNVLLYQGYVVIHSKKLVGFESSPNGSFFNMVNVQVEN
ncbi:ABC transporter substrate-binding protein [Bacillus ndiopicus]|uniref:ABC transporter substrate-binding protein n=1 Tax=Bacillus ndiopicus TaxID=1347368 RepID=UPI000694F3FD|nr:ABC transporter substrate-binding protein [Bacillus ndiopicus]